MIVAEAARLRDARTTEGGAPVNYACVFSQNGWEYKSLLAAAGRFGKVAQETATGRVFYTEPFPTVAGNLRIIKIRRPDPKRTERGDAGFTAADYRAFKEAHIGKPGVKIIERPGIEMVEIADSAFNALAYFSDPPLGRTLGLDF